jgi:hypothetical protein
MRHVSTFFLLTIVILRMPSDNKTPTVNAALISFCRFSDPLICEPSVRRVSIRQRRRL